MGLQQLFPTYVASCSALPSKISSACACIVSSTTSHASSTSTSSTLGNSNTGTSSSLPSSSSTTAYTTTITVCSSSSISFLTCPSPTITATITSYITLAASPTTLTEDVSFTAVQTEDITLAASTVTAVQTDFVAPNFAGATCNPSGPQPTFSLKVVGSASAGQFAALDVIAEVDNGPLALLDFASSADASFFTFNAACNLVSGGLIATIDPGVGEYETYFNTPAQIAQEPSGYTLAVCDVVEGFLQCSADGDVDWVLCSANTPYLALAKSLSVATALTDSTCMQIQLQPIFVLPSTEITNTSVVTATVTATTTISGPEPSTCTQAVGNPSFENPGGFYPWVTYTDSEDVQFSIEPCYEDANGCPDGNFALRITADENFENVPPYSPNISLSQSVNVCPYTTYYEAFNLRYTGTTGVNGTDPICYFGFSVGETEEWVFGAANQVAWHHWGNGPYYDVTYKKPFKTGSETWESFYLSISCDVGPWEIWLDNITLSTTCTGGNLRVLELGMIQSRLKASRGC